MQIYIYMYIMDVYVKIQDKVNINNKLVLKTMNLRKVDKSQLKFELIT